MNSTIAASGLKQQKRQLLELRLAGQGIRHANEPVRKRDDPGRFPLSFAQQRIWFLDQLEPGPQYNDPFHLRLEGPLDRRALQRALSEIARRHESLRACFDAVEGQPRQRILPPAEVALPVMDLTALGAAEREEQATRLAVEESRGAFDLSRGPLFRARLLCLHPAAHVLLLTFHHIAMDGWSRTMFLRELSVLYEAFAQGRPSPLPELSIQYADFAAWQQRQTQGEAWKQELSFWKKQLHGIPSLMEWPADFVRPARQSQRGARQELRIGRALTDELAELSRREGCTLFMTLLAAFQTLAFRHTGQADVVIGCPIANRNRSELEELIGCFLNTLVLRTSFAGDPGFREMLQRAREAAMAAYAHQDLAYEKLVEELNPKRDPSYNPVFQTMFIFQNTPPPPREVAGLSLTPFEAHNGTAKFDLTLSISETADGLAGWIEYATDLFKRDTIVRLTAHFQRLLEEIVRDPRQRVARLPMLTADERRQFSQWNDTRREFPFELCAHQLFEKQAAERPGAVAAEFGARRLSYRELDEHAERLASRLRSLGVKPEVPVGIYLERSLEMLVAVLGVLKAGGAFVPLDPMLPAERIGFVLEDSEAAVLITQPTLEKTVGDLARCNHETGLTRNIQGGVSGNLVLLSLRGNVQSASPSGAAWVRPQPENLAYVIYTSGSTGRPKGVQISHRAVVNAVESLRADLNITAADTWLAVTTLSFDIAVLELLLPLSVGGRVVIAPSETVIDGGCLSEELERSAATVMQATPTTWRLMLASGWTGQPRLKVLCGGEAWTAELARALLPRCGSLWNMYGPTETTIWSAIQSIKPEDDVLIGRPIANTQFYVLDPHLQPVPAGVTGELFIGGEGLARGYWRRPELTAEKFVPDHLSGRPGARLYKTGDLVRFREDGRIEFLGRTDHQVKIRGHRIETSEVEALLAAHPAIRECVVVAQLDASGENRLIAYIVSRAGRVEAVQEWRRYLMGKLPEYMIPAFFVPLLELPRTPNGKINRQELPKPKIAGAARVPGISAPMSPGETALAAIWREVLGVAEIGPDDNFFELGGHSLMVMQAIARIRRVFEVEFPLQTFFGEPCLATAAASIESLRSNCGPKR